MMITEDDILNRIAGTIYDNFDKFSWASTLGDKFEVWFQIELCLGFFGAWPGLNNQFHTTNGNLTREGSIDCQTSYKGTARSVDLLVAADGLPIHDLSLAPQNWSKCVYAVELKAGIPANREDAWKDMSHALTPAQVQARVGKFKDRGLAVFIVNAQDTTIKGLRSFEGQVQRIVDIAVAGRFTSWSLLRNSKFASPNFMILALVPFTNAGEAVLVHCVNNVLHWNPNMTRLLQFQQTQVKCGGFVMLD